MQVRLLYFDGCPNLRVTAEHLDTLAFENADVDVTLTIVDPPEEAEAEQFPGSSTVLVDGRDPFANPDDPIGLSCRIYPTPHGPAGSLAAPRPRGWGRPLGAAVIASPRGT